MISEDKLIEINNEVKNINSIINKNVNEDVNDMNRYNLYFKLILFPLYSFLFIIFNIIMINNINYFGNNSNYYLIMSPIVSSFIFNIYFYFVFLINNRYNDFEDSIMLYLFMPFLIILISILSSPLPLNIAYFLFGDFSFSSFLIFSSSFIFITSIFLFIFFLLKIFNIKFKNEDEVDKHIKKLKRQHKINNLSSFKKKSSIEKNITDNINTIEEYMALQHFIRKNNLVDMYYIFSGIESKLLHMNTNYNSFQEFENDFHNQNLNKQKLLILNK